MRVITHYMAKGMWTLKHYTLTISVYCMCTIEIQYEIYIICMTLDLSDLRFNFGGCNHNK